MMLGFGGFRDLGLSFWGRPCLSPMIKAPFCEGFGVSVIFSSQVENLFSFRTYISLIYLVFDSGALRHGICFAFD